MAQEQLSAAIPANLAYLGLDGSPREVPIWFHSNGSQLVLETPPKAPKVRAIAKDPKVRPYDLRP